MMEKKTKILCTLGPASMKPSVVRKMFHAGMNAARINIAHGDFHEYRAMIRNVRSVVDIPLVVDIKGPELRIQSKGVCEMLKGSVVEVGFSRKDELHFSHNIYHQLKVGDSVSIYDGLIKTRVVRKKNGRVGLKVNIGGSFEGNKGVNIPGKHVNVPFLTLKDKEAIRMSIKEKVDYIALSFVRSASDVKNLRRHLKGSEVGVISKIENHEGLQNIDEIIDTSDAVMIARGDLGVEVHTEKLPLIQKDIIVKCNIKGKPVIVATEMLKSMVENLRPTRAETSDVANAVLDGTDAVMLSEETSVGKHPVETVAIMGRILREVEPHAASKIPFTHYESIHRSIGKAVYDICQHIHIDKIVTLTRSGYTARLISRFRLHKDIMAVTNSNSVKRKLCLSYGVRPIVYKYMPAEEQITNSAIFLHKKGLLKLNETVLFTAGINTERDHATNTIQIHKIKELLNYYRKHK
ncbi:MAG: pyruvate kinase [Candidatus Altiarchaeota archaeon]